MKQSVLLLDDDFEVIATLKSIIGDAYHITITRSCAEALNALDNHPFSIAFLDVSLPDGNGLMILETIKKKFSDISVVMVSGASSIDDAVRAVKLGAYDFVEKPIFSDRIHILLKNLVERQKLIGKVSEEYGGIITVNDTMKNTLNLSRRVANSNASILIRAESGTGKDMLAKFIHTISNRRFNQMIKVNCAAIPEHLFESEFFGHEKGAFTGALRSKPGKFESAHKGTLFLDELGELPLPQQAKLLRVLEDCEITRVGAEAPIPIDTRIIAATNQDLEKMIKEGTFREDLYFRINVIALHIPPLRERQEDIAVLSHHFMETHNKEQGTAAVTISDKAINRLMKMPLPGNTRELRNIIQRLYYLRDGSEVSIEDIDKVALLDKNEVENYEFNELLDKPLPLIEARRLFERIYLNVYLQKNNYNVSKTAHMLKMIPNNLFRRIKELGLAFPKKSKDR